MIFNEFLVMKIYENILTGVLIYVKLALYGKMPRLNIFYK